MSSISVPLRPASRPPRREQLAVVLPFERRRPSARAEDVSVSVSVGAVGLERERLARARAAHPAGRARPAAPVRPVRPVRSGQSHRPARTASAERVIGPEVAVSPTGAPAFRLTRRGAIAVRLLMVGAIGLLALAAPLLVHRPAAGSSPSRAPVSFRVVQPGETLWQIAGEVAPGVDRRQTVDRIVELNALPSSGIHVGERLAIPPSPGRGADQP